jgi:hypothetical protein
MTDFDAIDYDIDQMMRDPKFDVDVWWTPDCGYIHLSRNPLAITAHCPDHVSMTDATHQLAAAWAEVMDGRRIGEWGVNAVRINGDTTTIDDWRDILAALAEQGYTVTRSDAPTDEARQRMDTPSDLLRTCDCDYSRGTNGGRCVECGRPIQSRSDAAMSKAEHVYYCRTCGKTRFVEWLHRDCAPQP